MPFPVGVLAIADKPRGAVAWAWAVCCSACFFGFNATVYTALLLYALALLMFGPMRDNQFAPA